VRQPIEPFDFTRLTRQDLAERGGKVEVRRFGRPCGGAATIGDWLRHLPHFLGAADFLDLIEAIVAARTTGRAVHWSMGAHVIKVGLAPIIADLIERHIITSISVNGALVIHDYEIAAVGGTSEDVDAALAEGTFGMSEQTGRAFATMVDRAAAEGVGLGQAAASFVATEGLPHAGFSLLAACHRYGVPVTVHAAPGTDIVHLHPALDAAKLGAVLMRDFQAFTSLVEQLGGGVYLNIGSAVILPETFLKAVAAVRNAGVDLGPLTCANLDFIRQYRPQTNVVKRPTAAGGRGLELIGQHEIMLPLLAAALVQRFWMPLEDQGEESPGR